MKYGIIGFPAVIFCWKKLKDKRNYKWYSEMFENKRLDLILYEIKQILGEEK